MRKYLRRGAVVLTSLALITACTQTSTTSEKPTSSQKPTTPTTEPTYEKTLTSVSVATQPSKTEYELGTKLDLAGAQLKITYSDGTSDTIAIKDNMISAVDMNTAGQKTVTVTYEYKGAKKTATFKITVKEKPVVVPVSVHFAKDMDHVTIGGRLVLAPVISPAGAELVWHSSDEAVATVADGVVTGHAYGNVVISVTQKGSDEVLATTKVYVLKQSAAPVNWAKYHYDKTKDILTFLSGGTMPNFTEIDMSQGNDKTRLDGLIIHADVKEDQLTLSGLDAAVVKVDGGSATSIIFSGCKIGKLAITKANADGAKPVRVELAAGTTIDEVAIDSLKAILTAKVEVPAVKVLKEATIQGTSSIEQVETIAKVAVEEGTTVEKLIVPKTTLSYDYGSCDYTDEDNTAVAVPVSSSGATLASDGSDAPTVNVAGKVDKVINEVPKTVVQGEGAVDAVETEQSITLGTSATVINTGANNITVTNEKDASKTTEVTTTDPRLSYDAADPENSAAPTEPIKVGDHLEVYTADEFVKAFAPTQTTAKIILASDITTDKLIEIKEPRELDLNTHKVTYQSTENGLYGEKPYPIHIIGGDLTIKNGDIEFRNTKNAFGKGISVGVKVREGGRLAIDGANFTVAYNDDAAKAQEFQFISVSGNEKAAEEGQPREQIDSRVEIKDGQLLATASDGITGNIFGIAVFGSQASLKMSGKTVVDLTAEKSVGISGNGTNDDVVNYGGTLIEIDDETKITATKMGIYHSQVGTLNIKGGEIKGHDAIYMKSGTANITGGTIMATAASFTEPASDFTPTSGDADLVGAAIVLWGQDQYKGDIELHIPTESQAKIAGDCALYERNWRNTTKDTFKTTVDIQNRDVFSGRVKTEADDYYAVVNETAFNHVVAMLSEDHTAEPEVKMVLTNDIQLTGQNDSSDIMFVWRDFTLDGNGHTIKGHNDGTFRQFIVRDKASTFKNVTLTEFGEKAGNDQSTSVITVDGVRYDGGYQFPFNNPKLALDKVTISHYNRRAIKAVAGVIDIRNSIFSCEVKEANDYKQGFDIGEYDGTVTGVIDNCEFFNQGTVLTGWSATAIAVGTGATDLTISNCNIHNVDNGITVVRYYGPGEAVWGNLPASNANVKIVNCTIAETIKDASIRLDEGTRSPIVGEATVTIDGGKYNLLHFQSFHEGAQVDGKGKIIVNDGEFKESYLLASVDSLPDDVMVVNGGTFVSKDGFNGGVTPYHYYIDDEDKEHFDPITGTKGVQIKGGTFDMNPTPYLAEGYEVNDSAPYVVKSTSTGE